MRKMIVMRGVSGSGKSTLAAKLAGEHGVVFSTDDFFVASDGDYQFNPSLLAEAHEWNRQRALTAMKVKRLLVIIDNTNTQAWEAREYVKAAQQYGYAVEFVEADTPWCKDAEECTARNSHGVPVHAIQSMLDRWEDDLTVAKCLAAKSPWEK